MLKRHGKREGFTLIEVLITMIILSISLLALAGLMATTTRNNSYGNHVTEAATLAQDKLEEIRGKLWSDVHEGRDQDKPRGCTGVEYTRIWDVVRQGNLKTITITINWTDRISHSIRLVSVLSQ